MPVSTREESVTPLYPGNVLGVYKTPLPLYPAAYYTLSVTVEQDPLKLFPLHEMISEDGWKHLADNEGIYQGDVIPFLMQLRGVWQLKERTTSPPNSCKYQWYRGDYLQPTSANPFGMLIGNALDYWWAYRAFRPRVDIYIGQELLRSVTYDDTRLAVVNHDGFYGWPGYYWAGSAFSDFDITATPCDAVHARSEEWDSVWVSPADRSLGVQKWRGGVDDVDYSVIIDGYGRMTVTVTSKYKDIRLEVSVEQDETKLPQNWGQSLGVDTTYWFPLDGTHYEEINDCDNPVAGYIGSMSGTTGYGHMRDNGAWNCASIYARWPVFGMGIPGCHAWTGGGSASVDETGYDWDSMGYQTSAKWPEQHITGYSQAKRTYIQTAPDPTLTRYHCSIRSPLLVGADKRRWWHGDLHELDPLGYEYTSGSTYSGIPDDGTPEAFDVFAEYLGMCDSRSDFERAYMPPKIKITSTATHNYQGGMNVTKYHYCDLPYTWDALHSKTTFGQWYQDLHADADDYTHPTNGERRYVEDRKSDDRYSRGTIGSGELQFTMMLNPDGFHPPVKTGGTLGEIYEAANDYIYNVEDAPAYPGGGMP